MSSVDAVMAVFDFHGDSEHLARAYAEVLRKVVAVSSGRPVVHLARRADRRQGHEARSQHDEDPGRTSGVRVHGRRTCGPRRRRSRPSRRTRRSAACSWTVACPNRRSGATRCTTWGGRSTRCRLYR